PDASAKRKRDGSGIPSTHYQNGADTHPDDDLEPSNKSSKKKKAARACAHCQKAHLTCDDSRPCQRCIKRGMAESCVEGHRKKAKYLLDEEELADGSNDFDSLMDLSFDPSYRFGSQTANLEYSMLSAILGNPRSETPSSNELPSPLSQSPAEMISPPQPPNLNAANGPDRSGQWRSAGDSVYSQVVTGYDYTQGYHFLMRFLSERFEKNDILRVVRALAIFRPSLIALQMPMTEQDEIFVERALQRSLLELEKLISYSGTPTAIWRRTGEICVVGLEFCMLTGWTKEDLVGQRKFIYELFENQSVVEYWENFASHAFENSTQSVYSHCVLLKPSGDPVPCAFCFTVRRNMFDLPDLIVGM
ncbi:hypothetical protein DL93DRAFT_2066262, partial [Clavulina sp. PMI_390]